MKKKLIVLTMIAGVLAFGALAFRSPAHPIHPHHKHKNLKVLPKNISHDQLMAVMHTFERSLGFSCSDCHAHSSSNPKKLDFASDANPKKDVARGMIKMVKKINRRQFKIKGKFVTNFLHGKYKVTCFTCHRGAEHPATIAPFKKKTHKNLLSIFIPTNRTFVPRKKDKDEHIFGTTKLQGRRF